MAPLRLRSIMLTMSKHSRTEQATSRKPTGDPLAGIGLVAAAHREPSSTCRTCGSLLSRRGFFDARESSLGPLGGALASAISAKFSVNLAQRRALSNRASASPGRVDDDP